MPTEPYLEQARELVRSKAGLRELIAFARTHDPTETLRAAWGQNYDAQLQRLLTEAQDTVRLGKEFPGSDAEVLLLMAYYVTTAPYLGTPEPVIQSALRNLLHQLV